MKRTTSLRARIVAMFLAVVCIVGLIPTTVFAEDRASSVPGTVTLKNSDYHVSDPIVYESGVLGKCYIHEFEMNVGGATTVGFCGDHSKEMGNSLIGDVWSNPTEITDKNVKLILSHFYSYSTGKFSPEGQAQGLTPYTEFETTWTQGWFQACVWLALGGNLPDYETDPTGWVEAVATERMARPSGSRPPMAPSWLRAAAPPAAMASTPQTGTDKSIFMDSSPAPMW